jgi:hypothetical protein
MQKITANKKKHTRGAVESIPCGYGLEDVGIGDGVRDRSGVP